MKPRPLLALAAALLVAAQVTGTTDDPGRWVALARTYLGGDAALDGVKSLHFEGSFATTEQVPDPAAPERMIEQPARVRIDIVFQAPMQQRQVLKSEHVERTTALDNYDAWEKVVDLTNGGQSRVFLLDGAGIRRLRATTVENLSFYATHRGSGRRVDFGGDASVDGMDCVKLVFSHAGNIAFIRFFEKATGRLVKTEVAGGGEIREDGEILEAGIRFPKRVINVSAKGQKTTITFDRVTVNESFGPEVFAVPLAAR